MITAYKFILFVLFLRTVAFASEELDLPGVYKPDVHPSSAHISVWGHGALGGRVDFIETLARKWEEGFKKYQPEVEFENRLHGTASAIGALYAGVADIALMGREIWPNEVDAFKEVMGYAPTGIDVITGSFDKRNRGYALVIFVQKDNPVTHLSFSQLDSIFSADHRRGKKPAHTWGDLGATGEWGARAVHPYGFALARGFADYFADAVFAGGKKWNPDLREFADQSGSTGGDTDGGQMMLAALAKDPSGVAISGLLYSHADVKPVSISEMDEGPFVEPTRENVLNHMYPLRRIITIFINRPPGQPLSPQLREFLRYVLSREAQQAVLDYGEGYLPLLRPFAEHELRKLD